MTRLLILIGIFAITQINGEVFHYELPINEKGAFYHQKVTLDFENNLQILEVPDHNAVTHSKYFFDFNSGKLIQSFPSLKTCLIRKIPETTPSMEQFKNTLMKRLKSTKDATLDASKATLKPKYYRKFDRVENLKSLSSSEAVLKECEGFDVSIVTHFTEEKGGKEHVPSQMTGTELDEFRSLFPQNRCTCTILPMCFWQTCIYGTDSCYYVLQCNEDDTECQEALHESNFHTGNVPLTCRPCYNEECKGCNNWDECKCLLPNFQKCEDFNQDIDYGGHCNKGVCELLQDNTRNIFTCPNTDFSEGYALEEDVCMQMCTAAPGTIEGYQTCTEEGKWEFTALPGQCPDAKEASSKYR